MMSYHTCIGRQRRQAAILVEQAVISQRAMKHAAWGAKKEIRSKLQTMKKSPYNASMRPVFPQIIPTRSRGDKRVAQRVIKKGGRFSSPATPPPTPALNKSPMDPSTAGKSSVLATPVGFRKVREDAGYQTTPTRSKTPPTSKPDPLLWKIGEDYGMSVLATYTPPTNNDRIALIILTMGWQGLLWYRPGALRVHKITRMLSHVLLMCMCLHVLECTLNVSLQ